MEHETVLDILAEELVTETPDEPDDFIGKSPSAAFMRGIMGAIRARACFVAVTVMIFFALSVAAAYLFFYATRPHVGTATALMSFGYIGAEEGSDPFGNPLDVGQIESPIVIDRALAHLGLHGITVEDVRQNLHISAVVPDDVLERIMVIHESALIYASSIEELAEVRFHPTQYVLRLYHRGGLEALSAQAVAGLLNEIFRQYAEWFKEEYSRGIFIDTAEHFDQSAYDYVQVIQILTGQASSMANYLYGMRGRAGNYRSPTTQMTFGDIYAHVELVRQLDVNRLSAMIFGGAMSRDRARAMQLTEYSLIRMQMELDIAESNAEAGIYYAEIFEKDYWVVDRSLPFDYEQIFRHASETYNDKLRDSLDEQIRAHSIREDIGFYTRYLNALRAGRAANPANVQFVEENIPVVQETLREWATITNQTAADFFALELYKDATRLVTPAHYTGVLSEYRGTMLLIVAIGTFAGYFIAILAVLWKEAFPSAAPRHGKKK